MRQTGFKGMGIRAKTLLVLALTLGFGISVLVLTLRGFLLNSFLRGEDKEMAQALRNVAGRIAVLLDDLAVVRVLTPAALQCLHAECNLFMFHGHPVRCRPPNSSASGSG